MTADHDPAVELVAQVLDKALIPADDKQWTEVARTTPGYADELRRWSRAVLDGLTAAGWTPPSVTVAAPCRHYDQRCKTLTGLCLLDCTSATPPEGDERG